MSFEDENDIYKLSAEELNNVPFDIVRWQCKIESCECFTRLRDYGITPIYYHKSGMNSDNGFSHWVNIEKEFFMCGKHWKQYKGKPVELLPLKKVWGSDDTKKEMIIY